MLRLLTRLLVVTLVIAVSPQLIRDIKVNSFGSAMLAAVVYGVLFVAIGWLIHIGVALLSIVPGVLTLGLFFLLV
ncbi:MAG: hypothetical protein ACHQ53_18940, partial [Polyangiales bacterium]